MDSSADGWSNAFRGIPVFPAGLTTSRIQLRVQAINYASRGWPAFPGTYPDGEKWIGGDSEGLAPVRQDWQELIGSTLDEVASWWSEKPYGVLVATGTAVNAIEVGPDLGHQAAKVLRKLDTPVPIVATPDRRWYFLTAEEAQLRPELAEISGVRVHGAGSWIPMPPTAFPQGTVHWRVKPEVCDWQLPSPAFVQEVLCAGLSVDSKSYEVAELAVAGS
ncbi:bifunctional DNA primase/polymerase [Saccharopolyspora rectivirgula]|jgi:hypothetical protein|uniref:DNA primase/polymerase bifunctional N-terminal domain-containing protein n=1 Tax=Saccharopolyspora rectivirgula TaxID=28042 RepID=A0A073B7Q0_9PSEU|nr:bifunctional DNA primase/polymerase [Saccharopolyspora rectivirgula]KEI43704.1 hypothetical protein GU90_15395 [Saccharopolyspora rectivirgula]